ncbi:MAG: hypothetical protein KAG14_03575 [Mycoplasmataceae bacterium]|nr:hypothetical protein [Mycoplasmataceae bacterium]
MRRVLKNNYILLLVVFFAFLLCSFKIVETDFNMYLGGTTDRLSVILQNATKSSSPQQLDNFVLFLNKPKEVARYIGISFQHENYGKIHLFSRQDAGVYYFLHPISGEYEHLDYRIVIDGIWGADKTHSNRVIDNHGHLISRISLDRSDLFKDVRPSVGENKRVLFQYRGQSGSRVYLNSDLGSWDPFLYRMTESDIDPGLYKIEIRMTSGVHYYYYSENGTKNLGPVIAKKMIHKIAGEVNQLNID